jgi:hypothetical protein
MGIPLFLIPGLVNSLALGQREFYQESYSLTTRCRSRIEADERVLSRGSGRPRFAGSCLRGAGELASVSEGGGRRLWGKARSKRWQVVNLSGTDTVEDLSRDIKQGSNIIIMIDPRVQLSCKASFHCWAWDLGTDVSFRRQCPTCRVWLPKFLGRHHSLARHIVTG